MFGTHVNNRHCEEHSCPPKPAFGRRRMRRSNPAFAGRRCEMDCFASLAMTLIGRRVGKACACPPFAIALSMVGTAQDGRCRKPFDNRRVWRISVITNAVSQYSIIRGGQTPCRGTLKRAIDRPTPFTACCCSLSICRTGWRAYRHDPVGSGTFAFVQMPAALAAVGYNAEPMLKIISRDPDRNIVASAGKLAAPGFGNVQ